MAADVLDLITTADCSARLAAGGVTLSTAQTAVLQPVVTAASREIQAELHRVIPAMDHDEILTPTRGRPDRGESSTVRLSHYPVNTSANQRVSASRQQALTIQNSDTGTNQIARIAFVTTGDPVFQLTYTGLTLTRVASGTRTSVELDWTDYPTIGSLATAINAISGGWSATVTNSTTPNFALWPTTELVGAREAKGAMSPGVGLDVFAVDLNSYSIDRGSGLVTLGWDNGGAFFGGSFGGYPGTSWGDADDDLSAFGSGYDQVRVSYNAGYATIPAEFQGFASEVVKAMLERLATDTTLAGESAKDYSYTARAVLNTTALATIMTSLMKYKDWSL